MSHTLMRLEMETHAFHRDADRRWIDLVAPDVTRTQVVDQLGRMWGFEAPLEAALAYTPHVTSVLGTRSRSRLLAHDLCELDVPPVRLPKCLIAPFPSLAEALGWLYVLERGARLHDMVWRNIVARLPALTIATSYLDDSGARIRWQRLGEALDRVARTPRIGNQIISAAHDGFRCWLGWFAREQALRRGA